MFNQQIENVSVPEVPAFDEFSDHTLVRETPGKRKLDGSGKDHMTQSLRDNSSESLDRAPQPRSMTKSIAGAHSRQYPERMQLQSVNMMNKRIDKL